MTTPSPLLGSNDLMTPCTAVASSQPALTTLPDLMQPVQTFMRVGVLPTSARTRWMFGFQRRFVRRCECDTDMPQDGPLPHTSHTAAMRVRSFQERVRPNAVFQVVKWYQRP